MIGGPKPCAQINLLFNLIMKYGIGCLSPINTTVIVFEEEWAQRPAKVRTQLCLHQSTSNTNRIALLKHTRVPTWRTCSHVGVHKHSRWTVCPGNGKEMRGGIKGGAYFLANSIQEPLGECMCVHVYMALHILNHGVLLINMVMSKQQGVLGKAEYYWDSSH